MNPFFTGLDVFKDEYWRKLKGRRLGLLSNQASLDKELTPAVKVISSLLPGQLKALFGPQHGYEGKEQDNMVETPHAHDHEMNLPIFSLYSKVREPLPEMFDPIDTLIIDLFDVGTRVYTFASSILGCLRAASKAGKQVIVLDRPNPLGGEIVEGNILKKDLFSFVGPAPLPMRHGLTMGEMAIIFNDHFNLGADLKVVTMKGWRRYMSWQDTGLRWIMPSPNMPSAETARVYPGQVIWEGTNLSEGRGTCRPFELFGAPFLDTKAVLDLLPREALLGCHLQEVSFCPTFHKWQGEICKGFMIYVLDHKTYSPYLTALSILQAVLQNHRDHFRWKEPPYEYEFKKMPIDLILGDSILRNKIEKGASPLNLKDSWIEDLRYFIEWRKPFLLYS